MSSDSDILDRLSRQLSDPQLPTQARIAEAIGVDQGFISHVRHRHVKRMTDRIKKLNKYVNALLDPRPTVIAELESYLDRGGDPQLLIQQVRILGAAQRLADFEH
jgi:predicted XRE-type DNA-binding protein